MKHWMPAIVTVKPASNERLPRSHSRGEVAILVVGRYRKVVLANRGNPMRRRGTFFSITA